MIKLVYNSDTLVYKGFYKEGIHKNIPSNHINIDKELYNYLLNLGVFKINNDIQLNNEILYTITNKDMFEVVKQEQPKPTPSLTDTQIAEMTLELANKDIQIKELETQQAQALLESVEKDIEIKNLQKDMADVILQLATQIKGGM